jgi:hypothetical protein
MHTAIRHQANRQDSQLSKRFKIADIVLCYFFKVLLLVKGLELSRPVSISNVYDDHTASFVFLVVVSEIIHNAVDGSPQVISRVVFCQFFERHSA